jgi:hypothetical protein
LLLERLTQTWKAWDCRQAPLSKALKLKHNDIVKVKNWTMFQVHYICMFDFNGAWIKLFRFLHRVAVVWCCCCRWTFLHGSLSSDDALPRRVCIKIYFHNKLLISFYFWKILVLNSIPLVMILYRLFSKKMLFGKIVVMTSCIMTMTEDF